MQTKLALALVAALTLSLGGQAFAAAPCKDPKTGKFMACPKPAASAAARCRDPKSGKLASCKAPGAVPVVAKAK